MPQKKHAAVVSGDLSLCTMSVGKQVRIIVVRPSVFAAPTITDQEFFPDTKLNGDKALLSSCDDARASFHPGLNTRKSATDEAARSALGPVRVITAKPSSPNASAGGSTSLSSFSEAHDAGSQHSASVNKSEQLQNLPTVEQLYSRVSFVREVDWVNKLFKWFANEHHRTHRYAAYVFGCGGEGKTRVVRALTEGKNVFECRLTEAYAFDGFESNTDILLVRM